MEENLNPKKPEILVVDDVLPDQKLLAKIVEQKVGASVTTASSGKEALQIISTHPIDLILLDVSMPEMSGDELVVQIRKEKSISELPIIMISSNSQISTVAKCLKAGANDYINKPLEVETTATRILTQLQVLNAVRVQMHLGELMALKALVTTYNHEINNPLAIAMRWIEILKEDPMRSEAIAKIDHSVTRIAEMVKKIREATEKETIAYETYVGAAKMVKVK